MSVHGTNRQHFAGKTVIFRLNCKSGWMGKHTAKCGLNRLLFLLKSDYDLLKVKSGWADLNRRPPRPKRGALPTALHPERVEYNPKQR